MLDLSPSQGGRGPSPTSPDLSTAQGPSLAVSDPFLPLYKGLGLTKSNRPELRESTDKALLIINNLYTNCGEMLADLDLDNPIWADRSRVERALHSQIRLSDLIEKTGTSVNFDTLLDIDLDRIHANLTAYQAKGIFRRMADRSLTDAQVVLGKVISVPDDVEALLKQVEFLKDLQDLLAEATRNRRIWTKLLGVSPKPEEKKDPHFWFRAAQLVLPLVEFCSYCKDHPDASRLQQLMKNPKPVYDAIQ